MIRVPPELNVNRPGEVLIVGRDPGEHEVEELRPFVGRAGELLDSVLSEAGWRRQDVNITNVVSYRPPENDFARHDPMVVQAGIDELKALCRRLRPSLIITLGNEAAYALVADWPTRGNGIHGAQHIYDRRGYFWQTPYGTVLTTLHPAGILRQEMPGKWLLRTDFRRAKRWITGRMKAERFPTIQRLTSAGALLQLQNSKIVSWDIETKWDHTGLLCSGYCGDDGQPYVAGSLREFHAFGKAVLAHPVAKVGHNGAGFDLPAMELFFDLKVNNYRHDTQTMWWALEPELAGSDQTDREEESGGRQMTRKGLAFLASLYFCVPWWKNYPKPDDPAYVPKMIELNGRDAWVTRELASAMLKEITQQNVGFQYEMAMATLPTLVRMQLRGLPVDDTLRQQRLDALEARAEQGREKSRVIALQIIEDRDLAPFRTMKKCSCCGGGKKQARQCWRCSGLPKDPKTLSKKAFFDMLALHCGLGLPNKLTRKDGEAMLQDCRTCAGTGKVKEYDFNPFSTQQLQKLLYDELFVPKSVWKGKTTMDDMALKKILRWTKGL